jgi:hypothetical protein
LAWGAPLRGWASELLRLADAGSRVFLLYRNFTQVFP